MAKPKFDLKFDPTLPPPCGQIPLPTPDENAVEAMARAQVALTNRDWRFSRFQCYLARALWALAFP